MQKSEIWRARKPQPFLTCKLYNLDFCQLNLNQAKGFQASGKY